MFELHSQLIQFDWSRGEEKTTNKNKSRRCNHYINEEYVQNLRIPVQKSFENIFIELFVLLIGERVKRVRQKSNFPFHRETRENIECDSESEFRCRHQTYLPDNRHIANNTKRKRKKRCPTASCSASLILHTMTIWPKYYLCIALREAIRKCMHPHCMRPDNVLRWTRTHTHTRNQWLRIFPFSVKRQQEKKATASTPLVCTVQCA